MLENACKNFRLLYNLNVIKHFIASQRAVFSIQARIHQESPDKNPGRPAVYEPGDLHSWTLTSENEYRINISFDKESIKI